MSKPVLGRGLNALLGTSGKAIRPAPERAFAPASDEPDPGNRDGVERVPLDRIRPCPFQPRKDFSGESIAELADSIRAQGILQPLVVRAVGDILELIAGERRWRAASSLGLAEVPVIIREADDETVLELALVENLQREDLNPLEEAQGYALLMRQFDLTQETVAAKVGKNRASVANALRLLKLAPEIQNHLRNGRLSVGHAKVVLGLAGAAKQLLAVEKILKEGLNVRATEELVAALADAVEGRSRGAGGGKSSGGTSARDPQVAAIESRLQEHLGTKVLLRYRKGKGAVEIRFFNDEDLERVLEVLGVSTD